MAEEKKVEALVLEFIGELEKKDRLDDLVDAFNKLIAEFGYDSFRCAELLRQGENLGPRYAFGELSHSWSSHYRAQEYVFSDVTVQQSLISKHPFTWRDVRKNLRINSVSQKIFSEAEHDFAFKDGLLVPIHLADGSISIVSIIGEDPDTTDSVRRGLGLAAMYLHSHARDRFNVENGITYQSDNDPVSRRQLDCIQWVAEGKTDWEIAQILGISESTVHHHIEAAKRNLNVKTRIQAVVAAAQRRLIVL